MPLTRNQQAALQASVQGDVGAGNEAEPHNAAASDGQTSASLLSGANGVGSSKGRGSNGQMTSQEMVSLAHHASSDHSGGWVAAFAHPGTSLSDDVFNHDAHQSTFDSSPSSSALFYRLQPNAGPVQTQHHQVHREAPPSPFYTAPQGEQRHANHPQLLQQEQHLRQMQQQHQQQQQQQQKERSMTTNESFMVGLHTQAAHLSPDKATFEGIPQRPSVFAATSFHGGPPVSVADSSSGNEGKQGNPALGPGFSTPQPMSKNGLTGPQHDHSRTYSLDRADPRAATLMQRRGVTQQQHQQLMQLHRTPDSADSSLSMEMDNVEMLTHMSMQQSASPLGHAIGGAEAVAGMRTIERQQRSLGQVSAGMNQVRTPCSDGMFRLTNGGGPMRTIDTSSLEPFGMHNFASSQPNSPPEQGMHPMHGNQSAFMGNFSPVSSISHSRHMGDSSIDTSTGSISNSATTMSAMHSQASSISSDFLGGGGSRKGPKVKTRLRNIDRKAICEAARDDPRVRQEDLAVRFNIERSTVSKTLKNKEKWLAIEDDGQHAMIVKHRSGKFPALEERLAGWIQDEVGINTPVLDITIKQRALQVAKELGIGIEQFKASVGWIDKFRERHGLPKFTSSYATMSIDDDDMRMSPSGAGPEDTLPAHLGEDNLSTQPSGMPSSEDMALLYTSRTDSPPNGLVPTASTPQRPRSNSMERMTGAQETPKASKRQYDDMVMDTRSATVHSSIDAGMARMHLPAGLGGRGHARVLTNEGNGKGSRGLTPHPHDDSGYAAAATKAGSSVSSSAASTSDDVGDAVPPLSSAKRRKGRHDGSAGAPAEGSSGAATELRSHLRRSHTMSRSRSAANVGAAASEEAQSQRTGSTPLSQSPQHSGEVSPIAFEGSPSSSRPDLLGMMQSAEASSPSHGGPSMTSFAAMDDRPVTLEEARLSLDVVLAFFERQPANLSRSDVFVLGNLQGQLSILANQQGQDVDQVEAAAAAVNAAVQQQRQREHDLAARQQQEEQQAQRQPDMQQQSQLQHSGLNMLGITGGDMTLVGEMDHRAR